jgi:hypothetical protein
MSSLKQQRFEAEGKEKKREGKKKDHGEKEGDDD